MEKEVNKEKNYKNVNKTREGIVKMFIESLEEDKIPWQAGWNNEFKFQEMYNGTSDRKYNGVNLLYLNYHALKFGYDDPRWITFNQAKENEWKVKKGEHGVPVEYWMMYDKKEKKCYTISKAMELIEKNIKTNDDFTFVAKNHYVFNAQQIEGIPELESKTQRIESDIQVNEFIENIKNNIGVNYDEFGTQAYYHPSTDKVVMPERSKFYGQKQFDSTLLHELSHATSHPSRLNRKTGKQGTKQYAKEELRAEIASTFLSAYIDMEVDEEHLQNHKAYIQYWIEDLKNKPKELFDAIKDAEKISNYLIEKGELEYILENESSLKNDDIEME